MTVGIVAQVPAYGPEQYGDKVKSPFKTITQHIPRCYEQ